MYELDENAERGFKEAVRGRQTQLAMEYLARLWGDIERRIKALEESAQSAAVPARKSAKDASSSD